MTVIISIRIARCFQSIQCIDAGKSKILDNFWFQTGTPIYLVDLLKQSNYDLRLLIDGMEVTASAFSEYRAEANNPLPMIYQSGYLTIKGYDKEVNLYTLGFPNDEVRYGFLNFCFLIIPKYRVMKPVSTSVLSCASFVPVTWKPLWNV